MERWHWTVTGAVSFSVAAAATGNASATGKCVSTAGFMCLAQLL